MKTKEEIREIAEEYLIQRKRQYSAIEPADKINYDKNDEILYGKRKGEYTDVFTVSYYYTVVNQERDAVIFIDAETGEVLYSINSHGYIEDYEK